MESAIRVGEVTQLAEAVARGVPVPVNGARPVLAIDGYSAAGKSTLARAVLRRLLSAGHVGLLLGTDDFMRLSRPQRVIGPGRYADHGDWYDIPRTEGVLRDLRQRRRGTLHLSGLYNHATGELDASRDIQLDGIDVVVLEGMYAIHPLLRPHLELALLVIAQHETLLRRSIYRDQVERGLPEQLVRERFLSINGPIYQLYEKTTRATADLVLDNTAGDYVVASAPTLVGRRVLDQRPQWENAGY
jgi:uridine kinase